MALGKVATNNATFVIVALQWPDDLAFRLGLTETAIGLGMMCGPAFAGLYNSHFYWALNKHCMVWYA